MPNNQTPDNTALALLSGHQWSGVPTNGRLAVTYSFSHAASMYGSDVANFSSSLREFSEANKAAVRKILQGIEAVCGLVFVEVQDTGAQSGQLRYAYSDAPNLAGFTGYGFAPSDRPEGGDIWIGNAQTALEWAHMRTNLILHETLHALGLKHPFDPPNTLPAEANTIFNTVMSYSTIAGIHHGSISRYPETPMPLDVAALQAMYGAAIFNADETIYDLSDEQFQTTFQTLWDSSGIDTLDASRLQQGAKLDLARGHRSDVGVTLQAFGYEQITTGHKVTRTDYSDTLALVSDIENAKGTSFDDILNGNDLSNVLSGGAGNDMLDGGAGTDHLLGGTGDDVFIVATGHKFIEGGEGCDVVQFSAVRADYTVTLSDNSIVVNRLNDANSSATLRDVEILKFADSTLPAQHFSTLAYIPENLSGQVFRLYKAVFNRTPDAEGFAFHLKSLHAGLPLPDLARQFMVSPEFRQLYGQPDNSEYVNQLYHNVLGREPDANGLTNHLQGLAAGISRADLLVCFSESAENIAAVSLIGQIPWT